MEGRLSLKRLFSKKHKAPDLKRICKKAVVSGVDSNSSRQRDPRITKQTLAPISVDEQQGKKYNEKSQLLQRPGAAAL